MMPGESWYSKSTVVTTLMRRHGLRLPGRLKLRARVEPVPACFRKFMSHFNTRNDGKSIQVKSKGFLGSFKRSRGRTLSRF